LEPCKQTFSNLTKFDSDSGVNEYIKTILGTNTQAKVIIGIITLLSDLKKYLMYCLAQKIHLQKFKTDFQLLNMSKAK